MTRTLQATGVSEVDTWPAVRGGGLPLRRIVVVQTQRLGDVLCATPVFTALRRQFPNARVAALVQRPMAAVLEQNPDVDEILTYDRVKTRRSPAERLRLARLLRDGRFDWALSLHASSSVAFALWQARIQWRTCVWRCGDAKPPHWRRTFHQHVRQDRRAGAQHEVEYNLDVLRSLGIEPQHEGYRVWLTPEERERAGSWLRERGWDESRPLAVIHPGHGGGRQEWPAESYAAVADGLVDRGCQVGISGGPGEEGLVAAVRAAMGSQGSLALCGGMPLRVFIGVLAQAHLFVSVSTGPMHLAGALKVPSVTLYGPTELRSEVVRFCPYDSPHRAVLSPVACECPGSKACAAPVCMQGIIPSMVLAAADELGWEGRHDMPRRCGVGDFAYCP